MLLLLGLTELDVTEEQALIRSRAAELQADIDLVSADEIRAQRVARRT